MTKNNPLLDLEELPQFAAIRPEHVALALDELLVSNQAVIHQLERTVLDDPDWESFARPLEDLEDRLGKMWSPVSHLNAVTDTEDLRKAYEKRREKLTAYRAALGQNKMIFQGYRNIGRAQTFLTWMRQKERSYLMRFVIFDFPVWNLSVRRESASKTSSRILLPCPTSLNTM